MWKKEKKKKEGGGGQNTKKKRLPVLNAGPQFSGDQITNKT